MGWAGLAGHHSNGAIWQVDMVASVTGWAKDYMGIIWVVECLRGADAKDLQLLTAVAIPASMQNRACGFLIHASVP